jgi:hypothetical protein
MQRSLNGTAKLREASLAQVNWGLRDLHGVYAATIFVLPQTLQNTLATANVNVPQ